MNNDHRINRQTLDDLSKKLLENYEHIPASKNWDEIEAQLPQHSIDQLFKQQLQDIEMTPSSNHWPHIKRQIPLYPRLYAHVIYVSKIAAVLLIGVTLYVFSSIYSNPSHFESKVKIRPLTFGEAVTQTAEMKKKEEKNVQQYKKNHPSRTKTITQTSEVERLLASLLTDDEFGDSLDLEHLATILEPLEPLPVFSAMASAAENEKILAESISIQRVKNLPKLPTIDLKISIPLIVVEEHEIEHLLEIYERFRQSRVKRTKK